MSGNLPIQKSFAFTKSVARKHVYPNIPSFKLLLNFQYFSPYLSADLNKMASAFNTSVSALEDELMQLILDGQINARIDSHNKVSEK